MVSLEDYKGAYRTVVKEDEKRGFIFHLVAYILVNILLIAMNILASFAVIWFPWPLCLWGIGVTSHYLEGVRWIDTELKKRELLAEKIAQRKYDDI